MPIYKGVNKQFFKEWCPEMSYILGFFAADGAMIKNSRGAHFIEFNITDKKLLYDVRDLMESEHKISERVRKSGCRTGYRLQIGSKEIFEDLLRLGFSPNKSKNIKFPRVPEYCLPDFIRGYFDGDGGVYFKKYLAKDRGKMRWVFQSGFTSGSKVFLITLHDVLKKYSNVKGGSIVTKERGFELKFSRHDSLALYQIMYNNASTSIFLKRKKDIFEKAFKELGYCSGSSTG